MRVDRSLFVCALLVTLVQHSWAEDLIVVGQVYGNDATIDRDKLPSRARFQELNRNSSPNGPQMEYEDFRDGVEDGLIRQALLVPLIEKYKQQHYQESTPTEEEFQRYAAWWEKELQQRNSASLTPREKTKEEQLEEDAFRVKMQSELDQLQQETKQPNLAIEKRVDLDAKILWRRTQLAEFPMQMSIKFLPEYKRESYIYRSYGGGRMLLQQTGRETADAMRRWIESEERAGNLTIKPEHRGRLYSHWQEPFISDDIGQAEETFLNPP